ncbi:hypothetical protein H6G80_27080 [Nostoc sp. FACHB-87]|uniref:hypothetical protein n=1 Tax=Nostocaceae TaxID=1162 RepID=UPI001684CF4E|nr:MULTISPECIES: hypothetical protein [Nostocaceae]MBD2457722.1 hypothetical protein [Nostoc sp. FACHB-87]MBD2478815.1 hypothetical protein [Anabaena sp. FACHB-83]
MAELSRIIQLRVEELETNLELTYSEIFTTVCQENNLNALALEEVLGCDCPHGLIGFIQESYESEVFGYFTE